MAMIVQILFSVFLLFALSRVVLQVRSAKITPGSFLFWSVVFIFALLSVIEPELPSFIANQLGIGRGADLVFYISIALLFYMIFRLSIAVEETRREITQLVRKIALENKKTAVKKSRS